MFIVRQSRPQDLDVIYRLAKHLDSYNLPYDKEAIAEILERSEKAFQKESTPDNSSFTFVIENQDNGEIVGTSMLYAKHGTHSSPHLYLDVLQDEHYSETLSKYMVHQALRIGYNYDGPSEIGGLILLPEFRGHKESLGKLLSFSRFLYIAMNRKIFRDEVLSELLPRLEEDGTSRMWKHFGKRFTGLTYREADRLSKDNKEFIKSLFPQGLVYTSLFPKEVRDEIGMVGPQTKGAEALLKRIGFRFCNQIDPFDGGPHFSAQTDKISLVANAREHTFLPSASDISEEGVRHLVGSEREDFRVCWTSIPSGQEKGLLSKRVQKSLALKEGDKFWTVPV